MAMLLGPGWVVIRLGAGDDHLVVVMRVGVDTNHFVVVIRVGADDDHLVAVIRVGADGNHLVVVITPTTTTRKPHCQQQQLITFNLDLEVSFLSFGVDGERGFMFF